MHRFTLLHDGSDQGWQATYLALHVATHLGAPLHVLHIDPSNQQNALAQRAAQVETGGHAAEVSITTDFLADYSKETLTRYSTNVDGFFLPRPLIPDAESASLFLEAFRCPLWTVSVEAKYNTMTVLVGDPALETHLIAESKTYANRLHQTLTGFILDAKVEAMVASESSNLKWMSFSEFNKEKLTQALGQLQADLLFTSITNFKLTADLPVNCVFVPIPPVT